VIAARDPAKAESARASILAGQQRVDILVNNAGVMAIPSGGPRTGWRRSWP
jgi:NADP-dependent 3-hydroxy acid dehydrogenase YdfG